MKTRSIYLLLRKPQEDEKAVKAFGVEHGEETCRALLAAGAPGLHFYTLNLEKVGPRHSAIVAQ